MISKAKYNVLKHIPRLPNYVDAHTVMTKSKLSTDEFTVVAKKILDEKYVLVQGSGDHARLTLRDKGWDAVQEYRYNPRTLSLAAVALSAAAVVIGILGIIFSGT